MIFSSKLKQAHFQSSPLLFAVILLASILLPARPAGAVEWSTLFTAQDVRDHLSTAQGREEALAFCHKMGITKVYVESFRDGYQAEENTLKTARDFFRQAGLKVSGCVTTTGIGKPSTGWKVAVCYTHRQNQERLESIFRFTAALFDEIMIDDFFFTDCECSECAAAKGAQSWEQYREKLMVQISRERVLGPAHAVNPKVKVIIKFPQWYEKFQERGYTPDQEAAIFDRIWVGTELRNPSSDEWGHKQQYESQILYRWLAEIGGSKTGGGWFDPFGTTPALYLDQPLATILAGAPEVFLFHYGALTSPEYQAQADALAARRVQYEKLATYVSDWSGIAAYKPVSSDPGEEAYVLDEIGMLGIPEAPTAHFPAGARAAILTTQALGDAELVPKLVRLLATGATAFISQPLAHRLNGDPRLPAPAPLDLEKNQYVKTLELGGGRLVVFSDALPHLTHVDAQNRVEQPTPELRSALEELRRQASDFAVTSLDAPPRVAVYPLGGRVAVVNFTELPVACRLTRLAGNAHVLTQLYAMDGAKLLSDGATLRLPPHAVLVVE
ncbi:MAG: hypothetical protein WAO35_18290 [Terriglobia bacterium]